MSTVLIHSVYVEALQQELFFQPPVVMQEHLLPPDLGSAGLIGEALGHAILQNEKFEGRVNVPEIRRNFGDELRWLAEIGDIDRYREVVHAAFSAQGITVTENPDAENPDPSQLHLTAA